MFSEIIETIDQYDYVPLTKYRILQTENDSLKGRIVELDAGTDE